ncbi:hypothetical protein JCGZ_10414 [Jatropha curcas]|uniref:Uncharacterized protein n=1 Tax=Jatropha curcas TaxID=180498 RepID=A0A067KLC6_JATCU|nr:hypothetical protein JCGZ_10414 [Jatropha curcas]
MARPLKRVHQGTDPPYMADRCTRGADLPKHGRQYRRLPSQTHGDPLHSNSTQTKHSSFTTQIIKQLTQHNASKQSSMHKYKSIITY